MDTSDHELQSAVATEIRIELAARQWKQVDLAERAGVTRETLNRYMRNKVGMPMSAFASLSRALGISPDELLARAMNRIGE